MHSLGIELITSEFVKSFTKREKIRHILNSVREGKIVILEGELLPDEHTELIKEIMLAISNDFYGIELHKVFKKKGMFKKTVYTIIEPRINGFKWMLNEKVYGFDIIAKLEN